MKEYVAETGGRYTYADDVLSLQELALSITALFGECSDMILSGCEISGSRIGPGYLWLAGKIRRFEGCADATFPYYIYEHNRSESVTYAKQINKRGRMIYAALGGTAVPTTEDPVTGALPRFIELTEEYQPRLRDKFFGKYALLLEPLRSQNVQRDLNLTGNMTVERNVESKSGLVVSSADGYTFRQKVSLDGASIGVYRGASLLCDISLTIDGEVVFSREGTAFATLAEHGFTCDYARLRGSRIGSLVLEGAQLFNSDDNTDQGAVKINYEGYQQGASRYRNFEVYDGKRCSVPLFKVEGAAGITTVNGALCIDNVSRGIVLRHSQLKSDAPLLGCVSWQDSNDEQIATIGYTADDNYDLRIENTIGDISCHPNGCFDVVGTLKVNGTDIAATYLTQTAGAQALAGKVDKIAGKGLSTEDFTTELRDKLAGITTSAISSDGKGYVLASDVAAALNGKVDRAANLADLADASEARRNLSVLSTMESNARFFKIGDLLSEIVVLSSSEIDGKTPEEIIALKQLKQQKARESLDAERRGTGELKLSKDQNLTDLPDRRRARQNLEVYSTIEIDNLLAGKLDNDQAYPGVVFTPELKAKLEAIRTGNFAGKNTEGISVAQSEGYALISAVKMELDKKANRLLDGYSEAEKSAVATNISVYTKTAADGRFGQLSNSFQDYISYLIRQGNSTAQARQILRDKLDTPSKNDLSLYLRKDSKLADLTLKDDDERRQVCKKLGAAFAAEYQTIITDTGWVSCGGSNAGTLMVRQIGSIVSIQGYVNTARRDGGNWGGVVATIPNTIQPPKYSVRCTAANWNDDHAYNRGCSFTIYGGSNRIQLFESGMYKTDVELNFTYFV